MRSFPGVPTSEALVFRWGWTTLPLLVDAAHDLQGALPFRLTTGEMLPSPPAGVGAAL
jgi:hypothetical protein